MKEKRQQDRRIYALQAEVCRAFAHPKRIEILNLLASGEKSVGELVEEMEIPKPNVSQHLSILRQCGAVTYRRDAQTLYYRLSTSKITEACHLMREVLAQRLAQEEEIMSGRPATRGRK